MNKNEYCLPYESFINGFFINKSFCDKLIIHFKDNKHLTNSGVFEKSDSQSQIVDTSIKQSLDLIFNDKKLFLQLDKHLNTAIKKYQTKYKVVKDLSIFTMIEHPLLMYYDKGWGYKEWHNERPFHKNRMMVWMLYLNDIEDGGTEFKYQKLKIPAKKGLLLMWPPDFTHTHRGVVSHTKEKYILTGWLGYKCQ